MTNDNISLTYDDVLIKPKKSRVNSRSDVDLESKLFSGENKTNKDIVLKRPIISANMDSVTGSEMAQAMNNNGALGITYRLQDIKEQVNDVENVEGLVGASVGVDEDYIENCNRLLEAGADFITLDVAHGHMVSFLEAIEDIRNEFPDIHLMAGNVATRKGAIDIFEAGADVVKVGIGPGSLCTTRIKSGVGVPQFTAVRKAYQAKKHLNSEKYHEYKDRSLRIVADGGIKRGGDMAKALGAGADAVMIGGLLASCPESATIKKEGNKIARGSASKSAREDNDLEVEKPVEGGEVEVEEGDEVKVIVKRLCNGVRSSFSYSGCKNIREFHDRVEFVRVTENTARRNPVHLDKSVK